ncbi:MAG: type IX secretion system outer membrane channel protein PorV [Fulvivirga sp.]|nr:type IX secretion system outer membrane channel protein PorV [Fulvivirga sp.]
MVKKFSLPFILFFCCAFLASAQQDSTTITGISGRKVITTAVPFLTITPDARAGGMGDVGAATTPDANSIYWNPAKTVFNEEENGVSLSYTPWLGKIVNDMWIFYGSGFMKLTKEQAVSASFRYFDLGEIFFTDDFGNEQGDFRPKELAINVSYSRMLSQNLSVGLTGKFIHSNLIGNFTSSTSGNLEAKPGNSVAADIGVYYNTALRGGNNSNIALAAVISNIGSKITYSDENNKDFIPTNLRIGSAFTTNLDPYNKITIGLDFNKLMVPSPQPDGSEDDKSLLGGMFGSFADAEGGFSEELKEITVSAGAEYWYNDTFAGRLGYFYESDEKGNRKYLTVGLGFRYQRFGIDFAYLVPQEQEHPLAETLRFSLLFNFGTKSVVEESVTDG